MNIDRSSWIVGSARPVLAALAVLAVLSLATPSASANITLTYTASADAASNSTGSGAVNSLSTGATPLVVGNFGYTITATTNDPGGGTTTFPGSSTLENLVFAVQNTGSTTDTLTIALTGAGYTLTGPLMANFSVSGSSSLKSSSDSTIASSSINSTAIPTVNGTTVTGTPGTGPGSQPYSWNGASPPLGNSNELLITTSGTFSESQLVQITLKAGDEVNLTFNTSAVPVPEPSSMAIAGLGALGLIGYGLRRRKSA